MSRDALELAAWVRLAAVFEAGDLHEHLVLNHADSRGLARLQDYAGRLTPVSRVRCLERTQGRQCRSHVGTLYVGPAGPLLHLFGLTPYDRDLAAITAPGSPDGAHLWRLEDCPAVVRVMCRRHRVDGASRELGVRRVDLETVLRTRAGDTPAMFYAGVHNSP